ncbi:unnamed protein product [Onchocerca flexuosa]|uniref:PH domain-containing protein n=1 Tax=Onchocerca flexuosa TaxID=387005 RepID=A0A183GY05_9BILA|nr:unnamed protein product [Onchocerca flexuosa]
MTIILASSTEENEKVWLCQLYESSSLLTQLGALVYKDVEKLLSNEVLRVNGSNVQQLIPFFEILSTNNRILSNTCTN